MHDRIDRPHIADGSDAIFQSESMTLNEAGYASTWITRLAILGTDEAPIARAWGSDDEPEVELVSASPVGESDPNEPSSDNAGVPPTIKPPGGGETAAGEYPDDDPHDDSLDEEVDVRQFDLLEADSAELASADHLYAGIVSALDANRDYIDFVGQEVDGLPEGMHLHLEYEGQRGYANLYAKLYPDGFELVVDTPSVSHRFIPDGDGDTIRRHDEDVEAVTTGLPLTGEVPSDVLADLVRQRMEAEAPNRDLEREVGLNFRPVGPQQLSYVLELAAEAAPATVPMSELFEIARRRGESAIEPSQEESGKAADEFTRYVESYLSRAGIDRAQLREGPVALPEVHDPRVGTMNIVVGETQPGYDMTPQGYYVGVTLQHNFQGGDSALSQFVDSLLEAEGVDPNTLKSLESLRKFSERSDVRTSLDYSVVHGQLFSYLSVESDRPDEEDVVESMRADTLEARLVRNFLRNPTVR